MTLLEQTALELAEEFAWEKFYIKRRHVKTLDHIASKPAFLIFYKFLGPRWVVMMDGMVLGHFSSRKKCYDKIQEVVDTAKEEVWLMKKTRSGFVVAFKRRPERG